MYKVIFQVKYTVLQTSEQTEKNIVYSRAFSGRNPVKEAATEMSEVFVSFQQFSSRQINERSSYRYSLMFPFKEPRIKKKLLDIIIFGFITGCI